MIDLLAIAAGNQANHSGIVKLGPDELWKLIFSQFIYGLDANLLAKPPPLSNCTVDGC